MYIVNLFPTYTSVSYFHQWAQGKALMFLPQQPGEVDQTEKMSLVKEFCGSGGDLNLYLLCPSPKTFTGALPFPPPSRTVVLNLCYSDVFELQLPETPGSIVGGEGFWELQSKTE